MSCCFGSPTGSVALGKMSALASLAALKEVPGGAEDSDENGFQWSKGIRAKTSIVVALTTIDAFFFTTMKWISCNWPNDEATAPPG